MKKEFITEYGIYKCNSSLNKVPKFILQSYMKFLGIEIRKGTSKETLCSFIDRYLDFEKKNSKKEIPLHKCLKYESKESKENRLYGCKFSEKDWNKIKEKWKKLNTT